LNHMHGVNTSIMGGAVKVRVEALTLKTAI